MIKASQLEIITNQISKLSQVFDYDFKIVTLGSAFTGKTSLLSRYFNNLFEKTTPTITVDFYSKNFKIGDKSILLTAYDTAGSESYMSMTQKYVRDKHCIMFTYDITQRSTFDDLEKWYKWADEIRRPDSICILIGTKLDLREERQVNFFEALKWSKNNKMSYFEVSSKESSNVE